MPSLKLTPDVTSDYVRLFLSVAPGDPKAVAKQAARITSGQERYQIVANRLPNMPWFFIGLIHSLEGDLSWKTHLHNGDPLSARTVHVPKGRPALGQPPFAWEDSALDALRYDGLDEYHDWSIAGMLYALEKFNGIGYRARGIPSPYLWAGSQHYTKGKFTDDGKFSATAVSDQIGAGVLLHSLCAGGSVALRAAEVRESAGLA